MTTASDRALLPIACTLSPGAGAAQMTRWREFNDDYLIETDRVPGLVIAHYAKVDDAVARLTELAHTEQSCCAFATWAIDTTHPDLRLKVTGTDDALTALTFVEYAPVTTDTTR